MAEDRQEHLPGLFDALVVTADGPGERLIHRLAEAGDVDSATELAQTGLFDLAILDVNLNGKMSFPVADIIMERRIPLIFASGYAADNFPAAFNSAPKLQKPFLIETLAKAIATARKGARH